MGYRAVVRRTLLVLISLVLVISSCGSARPTAAEWLDRWERALALVPDRALLDGPDVEAVCERALAALREERQLLLPTADASIDGAVRSWLEVAEETFFECPPRTGELQGFDLAYQRLADFESEVAAGLD